MKGKNVDPNISNILQVAGLINTILKPSKFQTHTRIIIYSNQPLLTFLGEWKLDNTSKKQKLELQPLKLNLSEEEQNTLGWTIKKMLSYEKNQK